MNEYKHLMELVEKTENFVISQMPDLVREVWLNYIFSSSFSIVCSGVVFYYSLKHLRKYLKIFNRDFFNDSTPGEDLLAPISGVCFIFAGIFLLVDIYDFILAFLTPKIIILKELAHLINEFSK